MSKLTMQRKALSKESMSLLMIFALSLAPSFAWPMKYFRRPPVYYPEKPKGENVRIGRFQVHFGSDDPGTQFSYADFANLRLWIQSVEGNLAPTSGVIPITILKGSSFLAQENVLTIPENLALLDAIAFLRTALPRAACATKLAN